jgi:type II secretory pathway pseudopilin PulG
MFASMQTRSLTRHRASPLRRGFTLTEALVSIMVTALAGSALMLGITSSIQTTEVGLQDTIARGIAEQLMDEALGLRYAGDGESASALSLGPTSWESGGNGRARFDDIDDFAGYRAQPPLSTWGANLGTDNGLGGQRHANFAMPAGYLNRWEETVDVYYVDNNDPTIRLPAGQTSNLRAVEVNISITDGNGRKRTVASLRRVVANIPTL